jgi:hypothetical protein
MPCWSPNCWVLLRRFQVSCAAAAVPTMGQHDGRQRTRDARMQREGTTFHGCHATRPPTRTSSLW